MGSHTKARRHEGKYLIVYLLRDFAPSCETSLLTTTNAVNGFVNLLVTLNETELTQSIQIWSVSSRPPRPPKWVAGEARTGSFVVARLAARREIATESSETPYCPKESVHLTRIHCRFNVLAPGIP